MSCVIGPEWEEGMKKREESGNEEEERGRLHEEKNCSKSSDEEEGKCPFDGVVISFNLAWFPDFVKWKTLSLLIMTP